MIYSGEADNADETSKNQEQPVQKDVNSKFQTFFRWRQKLREMKQNENYYLDDILNTHTEDLLQIFTDFFMTFPCIVLSNWKFLWKCPLEVSEYS